PSSAGRRIDHPADSMHETRVVVEIALQRASILEEHAVPEAAGTPRAEPPAAHGGRDGVVRAAVVHELLARGRDHARLTVRAGGGPVFRVRDDARIRPRVDEDAARPQDPAGFPEG